MLQVYRTLAALVESEFRDIVTQTRMIGGTVNSPNKLRLLVNDGSFVDIWLSMAGDYSYHWDRRKQTGEMYRWDNAPHHSNVSTFPAHFHDGDESPIAANNLSPLLEKALREVLAFVRRHL